MQVWVECLEMQFFLFPFLSDLVNNFCYPDFFPWTSVPTVQRVQEGPMGLWLAVSFAEFVSIWVKLPVWGDDWEAVLPCQYEQRYFNGLFRTSKWSWNYFWVQRRQLSIISPSSSFHCWLPQYYLSHKANTKLITKWSILNSALPNSSCGYYMHVHLPRLHSGCVLSANVPF